MDPVPRARIQAASASRSVIANGFDTHALVDAALESARGTLLARVLVDKARFSARLLSVAHVVLVVLHAALEEALAGLAAEYPIVVAADGILADRTGTHVGILSYVLLPGGGGTG